MGPLKRICHWGPLATLGIIKIITMMAIHCSRQCWPPGESFSAALYFLLFFSLSGSTMYHFINAAYKGPGFLPLKWMPAQSSDTEFLQYCTVCKGYKAPRSHHCRKCGRCVLKMDHHCPWINNCVGHFNHGHFTAFLASAVAGCCMSTYTLVSWLMRVLSYRMLTFQPPSLIVLILVVFTIGLSIGVALAVGMLLYFQLRAIFKNRTGIEDWIIEKAQYRRQGSGEVFVHPYSRGWLSDARDVLSFHCSPNGDGILWPVVEGCDQYTLTRLTTGNLTYEYHVELPIARRFGAKSNELYIEYDLREQLSQKQEKRRRTQRYRIISAVSGSWIPIRQGCCVVSHPPCTDEPRIKLDVDDVVLVTRWRTYWLFGEKEQDGRAECRTNRVRGWFPRTCAVEIVGGQYTRSSKRD